MRRFYTLFIVLTIAAQAVADPTSTYYAGIDGLTGESLKLKLKAIVNNHSYIDYSLLDEAYPDVYTLTDRGTQYVYDIFSAEQYTYQNGGFNKEHVVPKSWWNSHTSLDCYHDIISVIPALSAANSKKNNFPPGLVKSASYDNGRLRVGTPANGLGTSFTSVFEPYDEFKGDFARIYMYVATCYDDAPWGENGVASEFVSETWPTMNEWLYKMLLKWHNDDPVSEDERIINDRVLAVQGNRNPFVDYPALADHIWGDLREEAFALADATLYQHSTIQYPGTVSGTSAVNNICLSQTTVPCRSILIGNTVTKTIGVRLTGIQDDVSVTATVGSVTPATIAANTASAILTWTYTPTEEGSFDGKVTLSAADKSASVRIYGTAYDPSSSTGDDTIWELVTSSEDLEEGDDYLLVCRSKGSVAGELTGGYLTRITSDNLDATTTSFVGTPEGALVFTLGTSGNYFTFANNAGKRLGSVSSLNLSFGNSSASQSWSISINNTSSDVTIANSTENCGTIYFNSSSPRFKTYTSTTMTLPQLFHKKGAAVSHTFTWMVGDDVYATTSAYTGKEIIQPTVSPSADGYTFMGWTAAEEINADGTDITYFSTGDVASASATYRAVFAISSSSGDDTPLTLLSDDFSSITKGSVSSNGCSTQWTGDSSFPTVSNAYQAGGIVKLGKTSEPGSITSTVLQAGAGTEVTVSFDVKGWTTVEGTVVVSLGSLSQSVSYSAVMESTSFDNRSVTFTLADDNPALTLATSAKRAFIDNVTVSTVGSVVTYTGYTFYPEKQAQLHGDVNADGEVNVADVTALVAHILGTQCYDETNCDINGDGSINVADVTALVALILTAE